MKTLDEVMAAAEPGNPPFSNGTEYEVWAGSGRGCYDCRHEAGTEGCPILGAAIIAVVWPVEWTRRTIEWTAKRPFVPGKDPWYEPQPGDEVITGGTYQVVDECTEFEHRDNRGGPDPDPDPSPPPVAEIPGQLDIIDAYLDEAITELTPEMSSSAR